MAFTCEVGDLVIRKDTDSVGIIVKFDHEGDPYIDFIYGSFLCNDVNELVLDYISKYKNLEEEDL